jgi:hypothetical protein
MPKRKLIYQVIYREYYKEIISDDVWASYSKVDDAIAAAIKETKDTNLTDHPCWAFIIFSSPFDPVSIFPTMEEIKEDKDQEEMRIWAVIEKGGKILYQWGVTVEDEDTSILPKYAENPPSVLD